MNRGLASLFVLWIVLAGSAGLFLGRVVMEAAEALRQAVA